VVVLDTKLDAELLDLGLCRELLSRIQAARKDLGLEYADRIRLFIHAIDAGTVNGGRLGRVAHEHAALIASEALADAVIFEPPAEGAHVVPAVVEGIEFVLGIARA
jgi:hypothetical protein